MNLNDFYNRSSALDGYADFVKLHGGNMYEIFEEVGLDPEFLNNNSDSFFSHIKATKAMEIVAYRLNMPSFGLRVH